MKAINNISLIIGGLLFVLLAFILGKCSTESKIIYRTVKPDIVNFDSSGTIDTKIDSIFIEGKSKYVRVPYPVYVDSSKKEISHIDTLSIAELDTVIFTQILVRQKDTMNNIETISTKNMRTELNAKFRFNDSVMTIKIQNDIEQLNFITKTIIKQIQQEEFNWTRSDWFLASSHTATAISFFYLGTQLGKKQ